MYKALHITSGEEIIILSPKWRHKITDLREMDRSDQLVCQGCHQPLRVKSGEVKRPHFAHKHLKACSYGTETIEILAVRAVLYDWLERQFGDMVTVEKVLEEKTLPRPVDCWIDTGTTVIAYWIIEAGIKLETRENILAAFGSSDVHIHWVFLSQMLNEEKKEFHSLLLTPTERAFLVQTDFDLAGIKVGGEAGSSIHYLDAVNETLTTYRALVLFHKPNWYKGRKHSTPLSDARARRADGAFLHPRELDRLMKARRRQKGSAENLKNYQEREEQSSSQQWPAQTSTERSAAWKASLRETRQEELRCVECGQVTTNYWASFIDDSGQRVCRCRDCLN